MISRLPSQLERGRGCGHAQGGVCFNDDHDSFFAPDDHTKHWSRPMLAYNLNDATTSQQVVSLLKRLSRQKAVCEGRHVHSTIKGSVQESTPFFGNALIQMYGNCGSVNEAQAAFDKISQPDLYSWMALIKAYGCNGHLEDARAVFDKMPRRDVVAWTAIMASYMQHKQCEQVLCLFHQMVVDGFVMPDTFAFACVLNACSMTASLELGRLIHTCMVGTCRSLHMVVETALINLYGNCGRMLDAKSVFYKMPWKDVVCWNVMISACANNEENKEALILSNQMQLEGIKLTSITYVGVLNACENLAALKKGQIIHSAIQASEIERHIVVSTALINMYGKCKSVCHAKKVFALLSNHDVVAWTSMIAAFTHNGKFQEALMYFYQMLVKHIKPDGLTYVCAIDACAGLAAATAIGFEFHLAIMFSEYTVDVQIGHALLFMYIKCRCICEAKRMFEMFPLLNSATWNALIEALAAYGHDREVLLLFSQGHQKGLKPSDATFACLFISCSRIFAVEEGNLIYAALMESSKEHQLVSGTALVNMYGKSGRLQDAKAVFNSIPDQDIVAWNAMIKVLIQTENFQEALNLFHRVILLNIEPNQVSFVCAIEACSGLVSVKDGHEVHSVIVQMFCGLDVIMGTALLTMYSNCGCFSDARRVLQCLPDRDVVTFTSLIAGFVQSGLYMEALDLFTNMLCVAIEPDSISILCAVVTCASLAATNSGLGVHMIAIEAGYERELLLGTSLINMYGSWGSIQDACVLFKNLYHRDVSTWNAILGVLSCDGDGEQAKEYFYQLQVAKIMPDHTTFTCILGAFSHAGMVDDGWHLFGIMSRYFCLVPVADHFICMVDLLGRAGHLDTAEVLINAIPFQRASFAWRCLLGACKIHGNMEQGEHIARFCFEYDASTDSPYVMLSNLYAAVGQDNALGRCLEDECLGVGTLASDL